MDDSALDTQIPDPPTDDTRPHRGSPSSHELFRKAVKAVRRDRSQLYGAYFVLIAAQSDRGTTARTLRHMGIDPNEIASAARAEINLLDNPTP